MKVQYLLFSILILFTSILSAQTNFEWEQIEQARKASLKLEFINSIGDIYGYDELGQSLYFSKNDGHEWIEIFHIDERVVGSSPFVFEENNQTTFLSYKYRIYEHNWQSNSIEEKLNLNRNNVLDFKFMQNGDLVIASRNDLRLYSSQYRILAIHHWSTSEANIMLGNDINYVTNRHGQDETILEFSDDLSEVTTERSLNYQFDDIAYSEGYLITANRYSKDGGQTWQFIGLGLNRTINSIFKGNNGGVFGINKHRVYKFSSSEEGWSVVSSYFEQTHMWGNNIASVNNSNILININPEYCGSNKTVIYDENTSDFRILNTSIPLYYSENISAGVNERLFGSSECTSFFYSKKDRLSSWQMFFDFDGDFDDFSDVLAMPNGKFIGYDLGDVYLSDNAGRFWYNNRINNVSPSHGNIKIKGDNIYLVGSNKIYISNDFGISWETIVINANSNSIFTSNRKFIYSDIFVFPSELKLVDIDNKAEKVLQYDGSAIFGSNVQTSYNGTMIYILNYADKIILRSEDSGENFVEISTSVDLRGLRYSYVDHNNNLYVYSKQQIFVSYDQGENWRDISPIHPSIYEIKDLTVSFDDYIYIATNGAGILKAPVDSPTGIYENDINQFNIHPNPATTNINFNFDQIISNGNWLIHDVSGRQIKEGVINSPKLEIDVSQIKEGLYFIKFLGDNINGSTRFVKM